MPSIKFLKKEINNRIGEIIEDVYVLELSNPKIDLKKSDQIIDKAISIFDDLIFRIHKTKKDSKKDGFKLIKADLKSISNFPYLELFTLSESFETTVSNNLMLASETSVRAIYGDITLSPFVLAKLSAYR